MPTWESVMRTQISLPQPVPETVRSQRSPFVMGVKRFPSLNLLITQRPEGSAQLLTEDLRLFPGGEVAVNAPLRVHDGSRSGEPETQKRWRSGRAITSQASSMLKHYSRS